MRELVYLTGFMTSGKSTLGKILANVLGWNFYDLDKVIQKRESLLITEIFEQKGEEYFRNLETNILTELSNYNSTVISLGGGSLASQTNFDICKNTGKIVYIKVPPNVIFKRIKKKTDRPLFKKLVLEENSENKIMERINLLLQEREVYYNQADLIFESDYTSIGKTVDQIAREVKRMLYAKN